MASKLSTPYMPKLEMLKFPLLYSSGLSCLLRALLTRSAQFLNDERATEEGSLEYGDVGCKEKEP